MGIIDFLLKYADVIAIPFSLIAIGYNIYKWGYLMGVRYQKKEIQSESLKERYFKIYTPITKLFMDKHVTICVAMMTLTLSLRIKRSLKLIKKREFKEAIKAIGDRTGGNEEVGEIEYGGEFPIDKISTIVKDNLEYADEGLRFRVKNINREAIEESRSFVYEDRQPYAYHSSLSKLELELYNYVYAQHTKLKQVFG